MFGTLTRRLKGMVPQLSALSVLAAAVIFWSVFTAASTQTYFEIRVQLFPDYGFTEAYLAKFPLHLRAAIIEYKRSKLLEVYTRQFWTHVSEMKSREVMSAALRRMQPDRRAAILGDVPGGDEAAEALRHLEFIRDGSSEIVIIRGRHPDRAAAADLAESVVRAFEAFHADRRMNDRTYALTYLKGAYQRLDAELHDILSVAGPELAATRVAEDLLSQRLATILASRDMATVERIDAEASARAFNEAREVESAAACAGEIAGFKTAGSRYLDRHPARQQAKIALDACRARIDEKRVEEHRVREERARVARLKEQGFGAAMFALSEAMDELRLLSIARMPDAKEIGLVRQNAEAALMRYVDAYYDDRAFQSQLRVIDRTEKSVRPPWSAWFLVAAITLAGAGTTGGLVSARRSIRARASGASEVERLGTNVIVEIPPAGHGVRRIKRMLGLVDLYTHDRPASDTSERFKHLRTMLVKDFPDGPASLCVTSSIPGEGKTFCAANTAISFAAAGMRTILVDGDLRKARATEIFGLAGACGLGNILFEHDSPVGLCRPTHIRSLSVLPAGTVEKIYFIDPDRFAMLLEELKGSFDRVVVDLPPLTVSSDPLLAAKVADGTVLVARKDFVPESILRESIRRLQKPGIRFLGAVVNWSGPASGYFLE